jgi:hypothetical protein
LVRSKPYHIDFADLRSLNLRQNWRWFWWLPLAFAALGLFVGWSGGPWIAVFVALLFALVGVATIYLRTLFSMRGMRQAPMYQRQFRVLFERDALVQHVGDSVSRWTYGDFVKVDDEPEGLIIWLTRQQRFLIPRQAFESDEDYRVALDLAESGVMASYNGQ